MSNYDLINKLEELPYFNNLLKQGIIPINWVDYKIIYEFYCEELNRLKREKYRTGSIKRQAKENTAMEYNISERSVYLIIKKMRD